MDAFALAHLIAAMAHTRCLNNPVHEYTGHIHTALAYAKFFIETGHDYKPKDIIDAVIALAGDPRQGKWTSHPSPQKVQEWLESR